MMNRVAHTASLRSGNMLMDGLSLCCCYRWLRGSTATTLAYSTLFVKILVIAFRAQMTASFLRILVMHIFQDTLVSANITGIIDCTREVCRIGTLRLSHFGMTQRWVVTWKRLKERRPRCTGRIWSKHNCLCLVDHRLIVYIINPWRYYL